MKIAIPTELNILSEMFNKNGHRLFVVGGFVRNTLLGLPASDIDVCSGVLPERLGEMLPGVRVIFKAAQLGTVELHTNGLICEYTVFRSESYARGGAHKPSNVTFGATMEQDAFRRDFTINALYADCTTGQVFDPTGGLADLKNKLIRVTSVQPDEIMRSDGLRVLRLVRFACELGFSIEENSLLSAQNNVSGLACISSERIYDETVKLIMADCKYAVGEVEGQRAHYRAFVLLDSIGALQYIFKELLEGKGVLQNPQYHSYDVFDHSLRTLSASAPVLPVRLASLLHDVAKPVQMRKTGKMLMHDIVGAQMAGEMLSRLKAPNALSQRVCVLIAEHMFDLTGKARPITIKKHFVRIGLLAAEQLIMVREADFLGSGKQQLPIETAERFRTVLLKMKAENIPFSENDLNVTGNEIMQFLGIKPGKEVGDIKQMLFMHCIAYPNDNNKNRLLKIAKRFYSKR